MRGYATPAALAAFMVLAAAPGHTQGFKPTRPIELVVHTGPGGGNDVLARVITPIVEKEDLAPVRMVVVNKTGGNGSTAMSYLAERKGDPHVIALYTAAWLTAPLMSAEVRTQFHDLTPIANLLSEPAVIVVKADAPYRSLADFIEAAKKNPGKLLQAGSSLESRANLFRLVLQRQTGARWGHVPFPGGGERIASILGGHTHIFIGDPPEVADHVRNGNLRAIVQIADKRLPVFPTVPTMQEAGFDVPNLVAIRGVIAPPGLPRQVVEYWENLFGRLVKTESWRKYVADNHMEELYLRSGEISKLTDDAVARRRQLYAEFGIKLAR